MGNNNKNHIFFEILSTKARNMNLVIFVFVGFAVFCTTLPVEGAPAEEALNSERMDQGFMEVERMNPDLMELERMESKDLSERRGGKNHRKGNPSGRPAAGW